ncbi:MAG: rubrerythrin [Phycisphaerae bacterium]
MSDTITGDYILQMAERIEQNGAGFYTLAAQRCPEQARPALLGLAEDEATHQRQFQQIRQRLAMAPAGEIDPDGEPARYIRALLSRKFFDPSSDPASYFSGGESFRDILLTAVGLEKESVVFYEGLKAVVPEGDSRAIVELIIRTEMKHITDLVRQLTALEGGRVF